MMHPSRNFYEKRGVYLPWDDIEIGQSFFVPNGTIAEDSAALKQTAFRRGIRISHFETKEADGPGLRVRRIA